jgi:hypothetical protein
MEGLFLNGKGVPITVFAVVREFTPARALLRVEKKN